MGYKNKNLIVSLLVISISLVGILAINIKSAKTTTSMEVDKMVGTKVILIDPGHGGMDGGASASDGTVEKHINLNISLHLQKLLMESGYKAILTRDEDVGLYSDGGTVKEKKREDLNKRCELKKETDCNMFVSIHLNKFKQPSCKGAQVWYSNNPESGIVAKMMQNNLRMDLDESNTRLPKPAKDQYKVLRCNDTMPGVIVECGFLSNKQDLELLKDESYQKKIAESLCKSIREYFEKSN